MHIACYPIRYKNQKYSKATLIYELDISSVRVKSLHLSVDSKLNALSCSEVSSLSSERVSEDGERPEWRRDGGDSSSPRSMLGAKMRISGTLISLNLRLQTSRNCHFVSQTILQLNRRPQPNNFPINVVNALFRGLHLCSCVKLLTTSTGANFIMSAHDIPIMRTQIYLTQLGAIPFKK